MRTKPHTRNKPQESEEEPETVEEYELKQQYDAEVFLGMVSHAAGDQAHVDVVEVDAEQSSGETEAGKKSFDIKEKGSINLILIN